MHVCCSWNDSALSSFFFFSFRRSCGDVGNSLRIQCDQSNFSQSHKKIHLICFFLHISVFISKRTRMVGRHEMFFSYTYLVIVNDYRMKHWNFSNQTVSFCTMILSHVAIPFQEIKRFFLSSHWKRSDVIFNSKTLQNSQLTTRMNSNTSESLKKILEMEVSNIYLIISWLCWSWILRTTQRISACYIHGIGHMSYAYTRMLEHTNYYLLLALVLYCLQKRYLKTFCMVFCSFINIHIYNRQQHV